MEEKVVHMVLKVDLQCHRCYKKVRRIIYKIPQIQEQIYDEKQGTVLIKVVSSAPEKIMDKIFRKGDKSINSIHIKEPEKKNVEKEVEEKKEKIGPWAWVHQYRIVEEPKEEDPKAVGQPDQGNLPTQHSDSSNPMYEGRPSYQYQDYGIPDMPPSYDTRPIYDSYGGEYEYSEWDGRWGQYVGQPSGGPHPR